MVDMSCRKVFSEINVVSQGNFEYGTNYILSIILPIQIVWLIHKLRNGLLYNSVLRSSRIMYSDWI